MTTQNDKAIKELLLAAKKYGYEMKSTALGRAINKIIESNKLKQSVSTDDDDANN